MYLQEQTLILNLGEADIHCDIFTSEQHFINFKMAFEQHIK